MDIYDDRGNDNLISFSNLSVGNIFQLGFSYCMKTSEIAGSVNSFNAVYLHNGHLCYIEPDTEVELVNAELHICNLKG